MVERWKVEEKGTLADTRIFSLRERHAQSVTNPEKSGTFVYLDSPSWVNVIALTEQREVVMVEQFRVGTDQVTLELPGGMIDEGESPEEACARELKEESGYSGTSACLIGQVSPNPAIQNNYCHTGLIQGPLRLGAQQPDPNEELDVHLVPVGEIDGLIRNGKIHHALVVAAFFHWQLFNGMSTLPR